MKDKSSSQAFQTVVWTRKEIFLSFSADANGLFKAPPLDQFEPLYICNMLYKFWENALT